MITNAIIQIVFRLVLLLLSPLSLLNDVSLNSNILTSISTAQGWFTSLNVFIPIDVLLVVLGIVFTVELGVLVYRLIMWIKKFIPLISG